MYFVGERLTMMIAIGGSLIVNLRLATEVVNSLIRGLFDWLVIAIIIFS